ncbi:MAG TPA: peptidylprolyl isomerase [Bacillota bacterium]|nr:peptidylprolyl isomerase [Bacillota bacterium]
MRKKTLLQIIAILLLINIVTLFLWKKDSSSSVTFTNMDGKEVQKTEEVATIGSHPITYEDWINRLQETHGKEVLEEMVNQELVNQAAEERDISIEEKIIQRDIALLATMQHGRTEEEVSFEKEQWRDQIVYRYTLEALLTEDLSVDEEKVESYYDTYKKQYDFSESIQISHIIVQSMEEAEQVKKELDEGAPFELLAQEYSLDTDTKNNGGYLGHISAKSQFMPEGYFEKAVDMDNFSYSEPFQTGQGVAILYLHEHYPSYTFTYDELKPYIERELLLKDSDEQLGAKNLWETYDVEWMYE